MKRVRIFKTERFVVSWSYMDEARDLLQRDVAAAAMTWVVSGRLNFRLPDSYSGELRNHPNGVPAPWASRPGVGVVATSYAEEPDTTHVCVFPRRASAVRETGQLMEIADELVAGDDSIEEKLDVVARSKWDRNQDRVETERDRDKLERHAAEVVFRNTRAYRDLEAAAA